QIKIKKTYKTKMNISTNAFPPGIGKIKMKTANNSFCNSNWSPEQKQASWVAKQGKQKKAIRQWRKFKGQLDKVSKKIIQKKIRLTNKMVKKIRLGALMSMGKKTNMPMQSQPMLSRLQQKTSKSMRNMSRKLNHLSENL